MLDFFVIFSKSGIVLFTTVQSSLNVAVNKLVRNVILEERTQKLEHDNLVVQYHLDNEFELVFVVGYQKILTLTYVDKFLSDIQLAFRDKFADYDLRSMLRLNSSRAGFGVTSITPTGNNDENLKPLSIVDFSREFDKIYTRAVKAAKEAPKTQPGMRTFEQSAKSQKGVGSMIIKPSNNLTSKLTETNNKANKEAEAKKKIQPLTVAGDSNQNNISNENSLNGNSMESKMKKLIAGPKPAGGKVGKSGKSSKPEPKKRVKEMRTWDLGGKNSDDLDFSKRNAGLDQDMDVTSSSEMRNIASAINGLDENMDMNPDLELAAESDDDEPMDEDPEVDQQMNSSSKSSWFGSVLKTINYNKVLAKGDLDPILLQLRDHLIGKNVAADIATRLCESVSTKLEGQTVNTFTGLKGFVKASLEESILRILSPNRNLNILRDVQLKKPGPYVITFVGVNGVGKSTNLAKICNWLIVNEVRVLIVACDTFRAGAIEQLRTHVKALKSIHEKNGKSMLELYDKGYGKDPAGIAMEAIAHARNAGFGCCLVDTAGRMQDNEPLMKQLAKLIKINEPDLTLFVGEALVGNEAVDQLTKFNMALVDNGCRGVTSNSSAINGIVLTKFDTIDDQVGAAISMTYITGQPIVFVGVGQTYRDLKQLNAKAVVKALLK